MERFNDLKGTLKTAWNLVYRASVSRNDPMRTPVMATVEDAKAHQRTLVLREVKVATEQLFFFSDVRAPKVQHLKKNPQINILFWDPKRSVQIEMAGEGFVFSHNEQAKRYWSGLNIEGRSNYAAEGASGMPITRDSGYLPDFWSAEMDLTKTEFAYDNFVVIQVQVQHLDVLHLHPAGHQRARFDKSAGSDWSASWVVP
jgi:hypothetical protein